jgi:hypothetical protein
MVTKSVWDAPPLSPEDQQLIEAYRQNGRTVDELPYTVQFDQLMETLGKKDASLSEKHATYQRLLYLRKSGRLPRFYT